MEIALCLSFITLLYLLGKKFLYTPAACYLYLNFLALLWYYRGIFVGYSEVVLRNKANLHLALLPEVSYFYAATFLACFLSLWGLHKPERKSIQFNFQQSYEEKFRQIFYKKQSLYLFFLVSIFLTFIMLWHLNQVDLHTLSSVEKRNEPLKTIHHHAA